MTSLANVLVVACVATSFSLSAQPSVDIVLLTAPTVTETVDQTNLLYGWTTPVASTDQVWYLPPSGKKVLTSSKVLALEVDNTGLTGIFRLYFPASGLRMDLIVE